MVNFSLTPSEALKNSPIFSIILQSRVQFVIHKRIMFSSTKMISVSWKKVRCIFDPDKMAIAKYFFTLTPLKWSQKNSIYAALVPLP